MTDAPPSTAVAISEGPGALLAAIVTLAKDPSVDVAKLGALLEMQERMEAKQAERQFNEALSRVTRGMPRIAKNGTINLGKGKPIPFSRIEDMDAVIRPRLEAEGFTLSFDTGPREGGGAEVRGTLLHAGGHSRTASIGLPIDSGPGRNSLQAMGSTISYGRRYVMEMLLNLIREGVDDDGKSGGARFITEAQADELRALAAEVKRDEGQFLDRLFAGAVRSFDEIEDGSGYLAAKSTLEGLKRQAQSKGAS